MQLFRRYLQEVLLISLIRYRYSTNRGKEKPPDCGRSSFWLPELARLRLAATVAMNLGILRVGREEFW